MKDLYKLVEVDGEFVSPYRYKIIGGIFFKTCDILYMDTPIIRVSSEGKAKSLVFWLNVAFAEGFNHASKVLKTVIENVAHKDMSIDDLWDWYKKQNWGEK